MKHSAIGLLIFVSMASPVMASDSYYARVEDLVVCSNAAAWRAATYPSRTPARIKAAGCQTVAIDTRFVWSGDRTPADKTVGSEPSTWAELDGRRVVVNPNLLGPTTVAAALNVNFATVDGAVLCSSPLKLVEAASAGADDKWLADISCVRASGGVPVKRILPAVGGQLVWQVRYMPTDGQHRTVFGRSTDFVASSAPTVQR